MDVNVLQRLTNLCQSELPLHLDGWVRDLRVRDMGDLSYVRDSV
jgi:hypothetical protein